MAKLVFLAASPSFSANEFPKSYLFPYLRPPANSGRSLVSLSKLLRVRQLPVHAAVPGKSYWQLVRKLKWTSATPGFTQYFDDESGWLTNEWKRSAVVFWPERLHAETVVELFEWRAAHFCDEHLFDGQGGGEENVLEQGVALTEKILAEVKGSESHSRSYGGEDLYLLRCRGILLDLALKVKKGDLFRRIVRKYGQPDITVPTDQRRVYDALTIFTDDPTVVQEVGEGYSNVGYWLRLLKPCLEQNKSFVEDYVRKVANAHICDFSYFPVNRTSSLRSIFLNRHPEHIWDSSTTNAILQFSMQVPHIEAMGTILERIVNAQVPFALTNKASIAAMFAAVIAGVKRLLEAHNILPTAHRSIPYFFKAVVLKFVLPLLGIPPAPKVTNLALPPHACSSRASCPDCNELTQFLISPHRDEWVFAAMAQQCRHVETEIHCKYPSKWRPYFQTSRTNRGPRRVGYSIVKKVGLGREEAGKRWEKRRKWTEEVVGGVLKFGEGDDVWTEVKRGVKVGWDREVEKGGGEWWSSEGGGVVTGGGEGKRKWEGAEEGRVEKRARSDISGGDCGD
ncbi:hypothetical protein BDZ91DRAFT_785716 [Kalaharituber pfeilii]|nr:hypothetical protein BDZ91DRAFT_785716 [Kalaharituber pfeilii]